MNIKNFKELYEENKNLDKMFMKIYGNGKEIILKNKLELFFRRY